MSRTDDDIRDHWEAASEGGGGGEHDEPFDEHYEAGRPRHRGRRWLGVLGGLFVLLLLAGGAAAWWANGEVYPGHRGDPVDVTVPPGASTADIAQMLKDNGVIGNTQVFALYVRFEGAGPFKAGTFHLFKHEQYSTIVATLANPAKVQTDRVTVPEGMTLAGIADRVGQMPGRSAAKFLALARSGQIRSALEPANADPNAALEGVLFPDTYEFRRADDESVILQRMIDRFDQVAAELNIQQLAGQHGVSPYQIVTVASIVEREAKVPEDRGMVAQVIYNRLKQGMNLQFDSTVIYALGPSFTGQFAKPDTQIDSPYNTYKVKGLPPTPIAAPGKASLQAALAPTPGPWLYFVVVDKSGKAAFSTTFADQTKNIQLAHSRGL